MRYTKFGTTGVDVSGICLGCMSYGDPDRGSHPWSLDEERAAPSSAQRSRPASTSSTPPTCTPTAPARRSPGARCATSRPATRWSSPPRSSSPERQGPNGGGLVAQAHARRDRRLSLRRLGIDYVDLYQIHRWDSGDADRGDARGAARHRPRRQGALHRRLAMFAWQFAKALYTRRPPRLDPLRLDAGPLQPGLPRGGARDAAAVPRPGNRRHPLEPAGPRAARRHPQPLGAAATARGAERRATRTKCMARRTGRSSTARSRWRASAASTPRRWRSPGCCTSPAITAPIVGATKLHHLDQAVAAVDLKLDDEELGALEEPYRPHPVPGTPRSARAAPAAPLPVSWRLRGGGSSVGRSSGLWCQRSRVRAPFATPSRRAWRRSACECRPSLSAGEV